MVELYEKRTKQVRSAEEAIVFLSTFLDNEKGERLYDSRYDAKNHMVVYRVLLPNPSARVTSAATDLLVRLQAELGFRVVGFEHRKNASTIEVDVDIKEWPYKSLSQPLNEIEFTVVDFQVDPSIEICTYWIDVIKTARKHGLLEKIPESNEL